MKELLENLYACNPAMKWATMKSWKEIYEQCPKGEWLLWLFQRTNPDDLRLNVLVKAHCVNTISHLLIDKRSIDALDAAFAFGNGLINVSELTAFNKIAYKTYKEFIKDKPAYFYFAAKGVYLATLIRHGSYTDDVLRTINVSYLCGERKNENNFDLLTADIIREHIPIDKWNIDKNLTW